MMEKVSRDGFKKRPRNKMRKKYEKLTEALYNRPLCPALWAAIVEPRKILIKKIKVENADIRFSERGVYCKSMLKKIPRKIVIRIDHSNPLKIQEY